jgi:hypothetical protein
MKKKTIRLTESDLHGIVSKTISSLLNEKRLLGDEREQIIAELRSKIADLKRQRQEMKYLAKHATTEEEQEYYMSLKKEIDKKLKRVVAKEYNIAHWRRMTDAALERRGIVNKGTKPSRRYEEERAKAMNDPNNERLKLAIEKEKKAQEKQQQKIQQRETDALERERRKKEKEEMHQAEMAERKKIRDQRRAERQPEIEAAEKAYRKKYYQDNKEKFTAYNKQWYKNHPEYHREYRRRKQSENNQE